jgi:ankyrin repeat protein
VFVCLGFWRDERPARTALHHAADRGARNDEDAGAAAAVIELLLQRGARVDARNDVGETPLHGAAGWWCWASMRLLLDRGAEVDALDEQGRTPLVAMFQETAGANEPSAAEAVELLAARGADANAADEDGRSALSHACEHPGIDGDAVRAFLAAGARVGRESGAVLIDHLLAGADGAGELPKVGAVVALIDAGAGVSVRHLRALAEAAAGFAGAADPEEAQAFIEAYPRVVAAVDRALDEDADARVAARLAAAVEADRQDVASGLRALITGAAAETRRLEAARAALAEEERAAAAPNSSGGGDEAESLTKRARRG